MTDKPLTIELIDQLLGQAKPVPGPAKRKPTPFPSLVERWKPEAVVDMFIAQHCDECGGTTFAFAGRHIRELSTRGASRHGLLRELETTIGLSYEKRVEERNVPTCHGCAQDKIAADELVETAVFFNQRQGRLIP